jgi:hypothetical protein
MRSLVASVLAILLAGSLQAATYTVNQTGSQGDASTADGFCDRNAAAGNQNECTLHAAIQQANAVAGPHTIKFAAAITKITLTASMPQINAPITFDGTNAANVPSGGRVEIDGGGVFDCFVLQDVMTAANANGAKGSKVMNFVIRHCGGDGVDLSGHGYTVSGNRIGTNPAADSASGASDANAGAGISISGTVPVPASVPSLSSLLATLPQGFAGVAALQASLQSALTVIASPNIIAGNVVSGNNGTGIWLFGQGTVNTIVSGNIVGLSTNGLNAVPNGRGPGGSVNRAGIRISGTAYGNFIGPGNIVSANMGDGIALDSGAVILPNFIAGNLVGLGSAPTSVGNEVNGISVDTKPKTTGAGANNPTGIAAIIGPANTISDNKSTAPSADLDVVNSDTSGGMLISGGSTKIRVFANIFGLATFPAGSTPLGQASFGNAGNGMVVTTSDNEIRNNIILANARHGILLRGSSTNNNKIVGNFIGVSVPTGLSSLVSLGNVGDGIYISGASSTQIGGPAPSDANIIAANGRNGIALRQGSTTNGWANLIQRNKIYGNAFSGSGIGIDLERIPNNSDPLDQLQNPGTNYANFDQHRPAICGGLVDPPQCASASAPLFNGSATEVQWTLSARPNSSIRLEFFANPAGDADQIFLGEKVVSTDALGLPIGAGCDNGLCTANVGGTTDPVGMQIVANATDLFPSDVPPTSDQPPNPLTPANNTSEFSDPIVAARKLVITTAPPLPGGTTSQAYSQMFNATGGSGVFNNWVVSNGSAPTGLNLNPSSGLLSGTPSAVGTFNFAVQVTDSAGATAIAAYAITISPQPPLVITTASPLPNATIDVAYNLTFSASGGNGAASGWQIMSGELPDGLMLTAATGVLSGTPTEIGSFQFNVQVTDQQPTNAIKAFTLNVLPAPIPLAISTASPLPDGDQNVNYSTTFEAVGGSGYYSSWSIASGALPTGMQIDPASGVLNGKPSQSGTFNFTVGVTDSLTATAIKPFALTIEAAPVAPPAPQFSASPQILDFGGVSVGRSVTANVVLKNLSTASVSPQVRPASPSTEFSTDEGTCTAALAPNATCTMTVTFTPSAGDDTPFAATAAVCRPPIINNICFPNLSGLPPVLVRLTLKGLGTGTLARVTPRGIDFGTQPIGSQSNVAVTITNTTQGLLTFNPLVVLSNPNGFSAPSHTCGLGLLGSNSSCTITYRFQPAVPGAADSMSRITISNGTISEAYDITLSGTGVLTTAASTTTPMTLDFGEVNVGSVTTLPVITKNTSGQSITVTASAFGAADASVWSRTPLAACLSPIANNATCQHNYAFSPHAQGAYSTNTELAVTGIGINQFVPLSLNGVGAGSLIQATPQSLDFGQVPVGATVSAQVTLTNTSVDTLTRTFASAAPFNSATGCPSSLAPGATCTITYSLIADGDPIGLVESEATLLFTNAVTGNEQVVTINLQAQVVDAIFANGFE